MDSIFTRLFSYRPRQSRSPEEDFFTEILVGVFERNHAVLKYILSRLADIHCETIVNIDSQVSYASLNSQYTSDRPDIVIEARDTAEERIIIFIENKIDSEQGEDQLIRYAGQLERMCNGDRYSKGYLFYLTQRPEKTDEDKICAELKGKGSFIHKRWPEIYKMFSDFQEEFSGSYTVLLDELLKFMEDKKMSLKLALNDITAAMRFKNSEKVYWNILNEAWSASKISEFFNHSTTGGRWTSGDNETELTYSSPWLTKNKMRIYYGFRFDHTNINNNTIKNALIKKVSSEMPILFVSLGSDESDTKIVLDYLKGKEDINSFEDAGWRWVNEEDNNWILMAKVIDLKNLYCHDNCAIFFIDKFKEELDFIHQNIEVLL